MMQWIHSCQHNEWKNAKKGHVANATLGHELDIGVAYRKKVDFTWMKDQLATREVKGDSSRRGSLHDVGRGRNAAGGLGRRGSISA
jgi:ribonuclease HI